jgi:serine protease
VTLDGETRIQSLVNEQEIPDMVPGQIVVQYRAGYRALSRGLSEVPGYQVRRMSGDASTGQRVVFDLRNELKALGSGTVRERTLAEIDYLNTLPHVEFAQPNYIYRSLFIPTDPYYLNPDDRVLPPESLFTRRYFQWNYPLIKMDHLWEEWINLDGGIVPDLSDRVVAVLDTGIARSTGNKTGQDHEDFTSEGLTTVILKEYEYDFVSDDNDATDINYNNNVFHGTHVAGIIGALTDNNTGVASSGGGRDGLHCVRILPLRVLGEDGTGLSTDIADAIEYAAGIAVDGHQLDNPVDVINLSLGGTNINNNENLLPNAIKLAYEQGVVIVAAAGNNGDSTPFYPAAYEEVISVAAVDITATRAYYSNFGNTIEIAAPGGDFNYDFNFDSTVSNYRPDGVLSTTLTLKDGSYIDGYAFMKGTSMAAPHVAAAAVLVKQALDENGETDLSPNRIRQILRETAIDLGVEGRDDYYGHGLLNVYTAVERARGTSKDTLGPVLFPFTENLQSKLIRLKGENPSSSFSLRSIGDLEPITIESIETRSGGTWLEYDFTEGSVSADPGLNVEVRIKTDPEVYPDANEWLKDGNTYLETLEVEWSRDGIAGSEYVYIMYNVNGFPGDPVDVGTVYVSAIDASTNTARATTATTADKGYRYTISNIPGGGYYIGASTDKDGDGNRFDDDLDQQECYGFFMSNDTRKKLYLEAGFRYLGIDFTISDNH